MRVAVLAHSFPRFPGDTHGPFVKDLCEALARCGHELDVLVPFDPELRPDAGSPLAVHAFRYVWPDGAHRLGYSRTLKRDIGMHFAAYLQSPLYFAFAARALKRLARARQTELIHAHWLLPNGFIAAGTARSLGIPLAVTLHGSDVFMAERNPLFRAMARFAVRSAAHVTSCSADLRDRVLRICGPEAEAKVQLVANGTQVVSPAGDGKAGAALRARFGLEPAARLVVAVGRLVDKKGFAYLIEAAPRILGAGRDVAIVVGGGGDLQPSLEALAAARGVAQRVCFTGPLRHDEVLTLVAEGEVFVMPSVRDSGGNIDGLPIVVLEAMAAGRPVVASNVAGMPLAVDDGRTGILVPEKDPAALANAVVALLGRPEHARTLGERGRERVLVELNWDAVARRHDELYARARRGAGTAA